MGPALLLDPVADAWPGAGFVHTLRAMPRARSARTSRRQVFLWVLALLGSACGGDDGDGGVARPIAVLSAFPGELAALVERADITATTTIDGLEGKRFRVGTLHGAPVVLGMTGIGLANAALTTGAVLDRFAVAGVVVSGVAGSRYRIGDVVVPESWVLDDGTRYGADAAWLATARAVARRGVGGFARCVEVPPDLSPALVCLPHDPTMVVGGSGHSSGFAEDPLPCQSDGGDVFGCDIAPPEAASAVRAFGDADATSAALACISHQVSSRERGEACRSRPHGLRATTAYSTVRRGARRESGLEMLGYPRSQQKPGEICRLDEAFVAEDMETAAVAGAAAARGLPFIAFRATSDGAGDPLGLPGFPAQFFAYYPLAAENAARAVEAFLATLPARRDPD